ncbi:type I restriction endonuclease subunit R, partial [Tenacibaculum singaporense]
MAKGIHTELTFEAAIELSLLEDGGYVKGYSEDFNADLGIFPKYVIEFLKNSQPKQWEKLTNIHKDSVETKVIQRLLKELNTKGTLSVLRNGFTDYGVKFSMAFFKPEST